MTQDERLGRIDRSLVSIDRSVVSLERLAAEQGVFNERLIERLDRGAAAGMGVLSEGIRELSRMNGQLERQGIELERQGDELERQGDQLERLGAEYDRRAAERRAESKMEREALVRILERLDDVDPRRSTPDG